MVLELYGGDEYVNIEYFSFRYVIKGGTPKVYFFLGKIKICGHEVARKMVPSE